MSRINDVGFVKVQSDNLPKVGGYDFRFFAENDVFNVAETRGVKTKRTESENYGDSAVGYVELKREGNTCHVCGKICPEHRVNNKVYTVSMLVDEDHEKVRFVKCKDCAASEGGCKHAIAFLMWMYRSVLRFQAILSNNTFRHRYKKYSHPLDRTKPPIVKIIILNRLYFV